MPDTSDNLLPKIAAGDPAATEECLDRYGGLVWSLARRMCPTREEAEDAVQEIFVEVWRTAGRYDASLASEPTFIAMIARRRLIDRRRKASRRPNPGALIEEAVPGTTDGGDSAPAELVLSEDAELAREVIAELSEEQQRVLQLSFYFGQSHEKISRSTGLPLGTVKTHARRGLIKVRELIRQRRAERASAAGGQEVSP
ncbi:MAG: RNA polymerase sigma factor [Phycisphaerales bacterium]